MGNNFDLQIKWLNGSQFEIQAADSSTINGSDKLLVMEGDIPKEITMQQVSTYANVAGSYSYPVVHKTGDYTLTANDVVVIGSTNDLTITLPSAVGIEGRFYIVKAVYIPAPPFNITVTVTTINGEIIDNSGTTSAIAGSNVNTFISDGANWFILENL